MPCLAVASLPLLRYGASIFDQSRPSRISPTMIEWLGLPQANTPIKITPPGAFTPGSLPRHKFTSDFLSGSSGSSPSNRNYGGYRSYGWHSDCCCGFRNSSNSVSGCCRAANSPVSAPKRCGMNTSAYRSGHTRQNISACRPDDRGGSHSHRPSWRMDCSRGLRADGLRIGRRLRRM